MVFILEDNEIMASCIATAVKKAGEEIKIRCFSDAITAMQELDTGDLPRLIFLDVLLTGPDGFTFLNELASYRDTAKIPVVIVSSLNFQGKDLSSYGVVGILNKETMLPEDIIKYVKEYVKDGQN